MKPLYKHYDQQTLDMQFNNRLHVPDFADHFARWESLSRETETNLPLVKDIFYGSDERERLDIFPSTGRLSKTLVFIHGGYWHMLDKTMFYFIAKAFHSFGITTVLINYPLAPKARLDQIVSSVQRAMIWVNKHIESYNGDPDQIFIVGHSAGGHLAAMLLTTEWTTLDARIKPNFISGTCTISGLFNLLPVHLSDLNKVLKMDRQTSFQNSPVNLQTTKSGPLLIAVGKEETAEFNDQSKELYEAWHREGVNIEFLQIPELNHFSIIETIIDQSSVLNKAIRKLMNI